MNLTCNLWHNATWRATYPPTPPAPDYAGVKCQLRPSTRWAFVLSSFATYPAFMELILPKLTDVRQPGYDPVYGYFGKQFAGIAECPASSGQYYLVLSVFDVAKGFTNEYRVAMLEPTNFFDDPYFLTHYGGPYAPPWPVPYT